MPAGTDSRPTYAALLADERFVKAFFGESSVGLNLCRMDGVWLESNPRFLEIIGYSAEEANDGKLTYWQLTPRKYDPLEKIQLERLAETGRYGPYEKEFVRKDGSLVPVRLNGFIVELDGEKMIWSFIEDISAERALEAERVRAIQASKMASLGEMAAAIAHEVNNPLAIITGYAYLLPDAIAQGNTELAQEAVSEIRRAAERAGAITAGLKRLSRGTASSAFEPVDVRTVAAEAATLSGARTRAEGLELGLELATDAKIWGNAVQLSQVLVNLVNNAVDAVKDAPVRQVLLQARERGDTVELWVEDSGPGVAAEHSARLFDRFFTTKSPTEGTGLGLCVSRDLVVAMNGTLDYERVNDRTRFTVRLPRHPASNTQRSAR